MQIIYNKNIERVEIMNIEINVKLTKPLNSEQAQAISQLSETEKFLYLMEIRQEVFEVLELDFVENFKSKVQVDIV